MELPKRCSCTSFLQTTNRRAKTHWRWAPGAAEDHNDCRRNSVQQAALLTLQHKVLDYPQRCLSTTSRARGGRSMEPFPAANTVQHSHCRALLLPEFPPGLVWTLPVSGNWNGAQSSPTCQLQTQQKCGYSPLTSLWFGPRTLPLPANDPELCI